MTEPTPVTPIELPPGSVDAPKEWFRHPARVDDAVRSRLEAACAVVDGSIPGRMEASRDWWPVAIGWASEGAVPAMADLVVRPTSTGEVASVLAICNESRVPVTAAGGRSGVCGASVPVAGGVLLDMCGLSGIVDVDEDSLVADLAAGTFGPDVEEGLRQGFGLTLGHWPQSMDLSTVGGWLACRGAGQYSNRYGKIEDMVTGLEVVLADGTLITTGGNGPRAATGPDLTQLFVGSEGTLGVITKGRFRVHPVPTASDRRAFGFPTFADGLDACRTILRCGMSPAVLRLYDNTESARSFDLPGTNVLIVLDEGDPRIVDATMAVVDESCRGAQLLDAELVERWLEHRNDVSQLAPLWRAGVVVDTAEVSARWSRLPGLYSAVLDALGSVEGTLVASSHQSHAYTDGACLYFTFAGRDPNPDAPEAGFREHYYTAAWDALTHVVMDHGAAISHHHGIGVNRARFLPDALGAAFGTLSTVKAALDPNGILNPGKLGLANPFVGELDWRSPPS